GDRRRPDRGRAGRVAAGRHAVQAADRRSAVATLRRLLSALRRRSPAPGRRRGVVRRDLHALARQARPGHGLGVRRPGRRLRRLRPRRRVQGPRQRRLLRGDTGQLPPRGVLFHVQALPPVEPSRRRVPAAHQDRARQSQRRGRGPRGVLRVRRSAAHLRGRGLSLRPGPVLPPALVGAVWPGVHQPVAVARPPLAPCLRRRRAAPRGERLVGRSLRADRHPDRRRARLAQSADPARILPGPLAQRPVLQGPDRVLRAGRPLPLLRSRMRQDLRSFVADYEAAFPSEVVHVTEPISTDFDVMALVLEYERRRRFPILLLERVQGSDIPIVCNVVASRRALAFALGVPESGLALEYARRIKDPIKPTIVADPPFRQRVLTGPALDLARLPIPTYFPGDAGRYLTAGLLVARDPETGVETEGYHRFQVKGRDRMGVSLHSRRRMFEYQRRAEALKQPLPCAIALGVHPLVSMGSLAYPPRDVGKFEVAGGLLGEPLEVAPCTSIDLQVPAAAEIVIEGEILPGVREPEGPFGEFTGYFSRRSTEHVFKAKAISMRAAPWFQSIGS